MFLVHLLGYEDIDFLVVPLIPDETHSDVMKFLKNKSFCNVDCGTSIFENGDLSDNYKKTKQNIYFCILGEVSFIIFRTHISSCMFCNIYTISSCWNLDFNNVFIFWEHVLKLVLRAGRAPQKYTCEQKPHEN